MNLFLVGVGNMGAAIGQAFLKAKPSLFKSMQIFDSSVEKCAALAKKGAIVVDSIKKAKLDAKTVVLVAVKPQDIVNVLEELEQKMPKESLLISIAAGISLKQLKKFSGHQAIVRVMPNTPALIGCGASAWVASSGVTIAQKHTVQAMLEAFGLAIEVSSEEAIDAVTALSGSGPAYVFYFLEALIFGGQKLGLSVEQSRLLAIQTVLGSAQLAKQRALNLEELQILRANVTSKGGTTEKAINFFEEKNFKEIIEKAMEAAFKRAKELSVAMKKN
ncbi:MAG: pyrroline-5-carboxylate reductase, pyrroline-5-carboxylate reductase [Candidatus Peregrinibacteria bacterium GW2011_GWE2_39_6]|nr:MAG: pyrroline-5-carboxylate reductase, pyrroline-5-carboxylate reductase [Candidatus Peregrinibacteria bacterium GW2011_GWF2_39_17]KKR25126.1 MAG: pyrroline-5-carboxylate reductase, pyrroline-5-carboxylate reductase [Candidatus Peregrinibacteria bacterium GW2011_GWE2_39_6]HCW31965.1 pyrroline-5-carboxylate reductase [Candidatus Peregrinibacteria bacterium]